MIGIKDIGIYLPSHRASNYDLKEKFSIGDDFIEKLGVHSRAIKDKSMKTSDMCIEAYKHLRDRANIREEDIKCCAVVTQNPDFRLPHVSAIVHGRLNLPEDCACFDISLGCSGYVYGLAVLLSFMKEYSISDGLLFTADPYSEIIDEDDKNTVLLFGDASTVTYMSSDPIFILKDAVFSTDGKEYDAIMVDEGKLKMNGRKVFNFVSLKVPGQIYKLLERNDLSIDSIDAYVLHPGSKYMLDFLISRIEIPREKVLFDMWDYGNTVSSSIPIMLSKIMDKENIKTVLISGYGVGLSWASAILERR